MSLCASPQCQADISAQDETQPTCKKCQKLGIACDGPRTLVFVTGKIVKSRRTQHSSKKTTDVTTTPEWKTEDVEKLASVSPPYQSSPQHIGLRFNEYEVYICHLRQYLYPNGPVDLGLQQLRTSDLALSRYPTIGAGTNPLFNQAALTFATLLFGAQHHQARILAKGYDMHGVALRQLNQALSIPGCHERDDIINVITIMAMLEMCLPSGPRNWLKHMLGLEQLIALRDPGSLAYASTQTLELYKGVRHMILLASLRNRSPSILARHRWKAVLRTPLSLETREERELHDVMADCTVLIAASDELPSTISPHDRVCLERIEEIQRKAGELLTFLQTWKQKWDNEKENSCTTEDDFEAICAGAPQALWTVYKFRNDSIARMFMLYNTAMIHVLQIVEETKELRAQSGFPGTETSDTFYLIHATGIDIARSIPGYLQQRRYRGDTGFTSPVVQWAALMAWQVLGRDESAEGKWMVDALQGYSEYAIAKAAWEV
ncbi:hypothetical protein COCCADRAFT_25363 [Bipolaris zeicola 26-R-13]|uniref:Zn(2)-C6 fungal-type domain-containing protein n=1 Tax=Cochliobolus carbonum (strain 26-R-13) TaxID=930089 RepID=W6Y440_COCC2|nr:uncharacterized protein COCCADRAFT_25363 [Bipolaris zeicola 26-R-13]EUC34482.1 hypothetical protein COCCADRAFT_25363 [Bipolaris zeicola 26-R-13]